MNVHARRLIGPLTAAAVSCSPVVVVCGARHAAKTPMVRAIPELAGWPYRTLDDLETLDASSNDPARGPWSEGHGILDEIQRCPGILAAMSRPTIQRAAGARFVAIGSADMRRHWASDSATAAQFVTVWPLTRREQLGQAAAGCWTRLFEEPPERWPDLLAADPAPAEDWRAFTRRGGYPTPACDLSTDEARSAWFVAYEKTFLEKDVRDLAPMASIIDVRRVMRAASRRVGTLANQTEIAREIGLSQPTVFRHLGLLESTYQIVRVPGDPGTPARRGLTTPKLYWSDTGLALHLAGEREPRRAHFENAVLMDLVAWRGAQNDEPELRYFRPVNGAEVEFVVAWRGRLLPIAVRSSASPRFGDGRGIAEFRAERKKNALPGLLLHEGDEISWVRDGVLAAPWWRVL